MVCKTRARLHPILHERLAPGNIFICLPIFLFFCVERTRSKIRSWAVTLAETRMYPKSPLWMDGQSIMCIYILLQYFRDTQSRVFGSTSGRNHNTRERNECTFCLVRNDGVNTQDMDQGYFSTYSLTHPSIQGPCLSYIQSYLASTRKTRERLDVM